MFLFVFNFSKIIFLYLTVGAAAGPGAAGANSNAAPLPLIDEMDLSIQCNPAFMRATVGKLVSSQTAATNSRLPLGLVCKPMAGDVGIDNDGTPYILNFSMHVDDFTSIFLEIVLSVEKKRFSLHYFCTQFLTFDAFIVLRRVFLFLFKISTPHNCTEIEVVDFGATGIVRCKRCRTYINPYVTWADNGRRWRCNICGMQNDVPSTYFSHLDNNGHRRDRDQRPELSRCSVEFVAPGDYMVRTIPKTIKWLETQLW